MATPDPTNVLFKIAHPDLYERNPFNLLNLPIDATAKDIRRRQEDIDAAFEAGTEEEEFKYVLPLDNRRKPPTQDAVHEAFDALNDPEIRIAYSLFWFWNVASEESALPNRQGNGSLEPYGDITDDTIDMWESLTVSEDTDGKVAACHNLATYYHLMALSMERSMLEFKGNQRELEAAKDHLSQRDAEAAQMNEMLRNLRNRPRKDPGSRLATIMEQTQDLVFEQRKLSDYQIEKLVKKIAAEYVALDQRYRNIDALLGEVREFLNDCDIELGDVQVREFFIGRTNIYGHNEARKADDFWREAIRYWNMIAASPANWRYVGEQVTSLNDPRLDYRFARSLRDQFAFAFDQINVELAIAFAKVGRESDAKRQVDYMKLSQPDADDVEGTFDDAFAGLQKQVEAIVNAGREEANKNPKAGLAKVDEILERTKEPVQISRIIFDKGEPIRESVITTIFAGARSCMIAYGNETNDWDGCLKRIDALKALAENDRQVALVAEDERIIAGNKESKDEEETCWFCKRLYSSNNPKMSKTVHVWGDMKKEVTNIRIVGVDEDYEIKFSKRDIEVPICASCRAFYTCENHPRVKVWLDKGWKIGEKPTQEEVDKFVNPFQFAKTGSRDPVLRMGPKISDQQLLVLGLLIVCWVLFLIGLIFFGGCDAMLK